MGRVREGPATSPGTTPRDASPTTSTRSRDARAGSTSPGPRAATRPQSENLLPPAVCTVSESLRQDFFKRLPKTRPGVVKRVFRAVLIGFPKTREILVQIATLEVRRQIYRVFPLAPVRTKKTGCGFESNVDGTLKRTQQIPIIFLTSFTKSGCARPRSAEGLKHRPKEMQDEPLGINSFSVSDGVVVDSSKQPVPRKIVIWITTWKYVVVHRLFKKGFSAFPDDGGIQIASGDHLGKFFLFYDVQTSRTSDLTRFPFRHAFSQIENIQSCEDAVQSRSACGRST